MWEWSGLVTKKWLQMYCGEVFHSFDTVLYRFMKRQSSYSHTLTLMLICFRRIHLEHISSFSWDGSAGCSGMFIRQLVGELGTER